MNKTIIATSLLVATTGLTSISEPASAAMPCKSIGITNAFGAADGSVPVNLDLGDPDGPTFHDYSCHSSGMRLYQSRADTHYEITILRRVAKDSVVRHFHTIFCVSSKKARMITLMWVYSNIRLNKREAIYWNKFAQHYANSHHCRSFK